METRERLVSEIMKHDVVTLAPEETLDLSDDVMSLGRIRHMPVVENEKLVGIVSRSDLLGASLTQAFDFTPERRRAFLRCIAVRDVMTKDVVAAGPTTTLEEAARIFRKRQISGLPIVDSDGTLRGILTQSDLLDAAYLDPKHTDAPADGAGESAFSSWITGEVRDLERLRDELRVQIHLGKAEVRARWTALERGLEALEMRSRRAADSAREPLKELEADAKKLVSDLREGFKRIRDAL
ncbi:MAG: CBS domain-containing protein [Myxococcota bacterium]